MKKVCIDEDHLVDIVDEDDNVIGAETKSVKYEKGLISRNVVAFLINAEGKYIVVRRAGTKKSFPNLLDISVCGNVDRGESYEDAIKREAKEELGVEIQELKLLKKILHETQEKGKRLRYFTGIYSGLVMGKIKTDCEEFSEVIFLAPGELKQMVEFSPENFTPFFVNDYRSVKGFLGEE